jgi:hypothetical protein
MKLPINKIMDVQQFLATKAGGELKPLLEQFTLLLNSLIKLSTSQITFSDNIKADVRELVVPGLGDQVNVTGVANILNTELFNLSARPTIILPQEHDRADVSTTYKFNWRWDGRDNKCYVYIRLDAPVADSTKFKILVVY